MRFSMSGLMVYVASAGVMLGLTRLPYLVGCTALVIGVVVAKLFMPIRTWRSAAYGGILGMVAAVVALACYLEFAMPGPRTYNDGRLEIANSMRPYVVHMGALVGATAGLIHNKAKAQ